MIKTREITDPNSCLNRANNGEMLFVLLGRDTVAADTIRYWVRRRVLAGKNTPDDPQITEAEMCANHMDVHGDGRSALNPAPVAVSALMNQVKVSANFLMDLCHSRSKAAGWWKDVDGTNLLDKPWRGFVIATKLLLGVSEICEGMEGDRKGLMDEHLPHRPSLEVELADAVIRLNDLAGALGFDLGGAIAEKMAYNARRIDHTFAARQDEGGKKY